MREALQQFKAALLLGETSDYWNDWGATQFALGAEDQAELGFRKALALDENNLPVAANLGALLVAQQRFIEAAPFLMAALSTPDPSLRAAVEAIIAKYPAPSTNGGIGTAESHKNTVPS